MPNDQSHDTRTTDPLQRAVQAVNLNVAYRASDTPAGVLFTENFDDQPDFTSTQHSTDTLQDAASGYIIPDNWTAVYQGTSWSPELGYPNNVATASIVSSPPGRNGGKCFRGIRESNEDATGGNFQSDGQLIKAPIDPVNPDGTDELYVEFWIRFDANWWHLGNNVNGDYPGGWQSKIFRAASWEVGGNYISGAQRQMGPMFYWDYGANNFGIRNNTTFRGGPPASMVSTDNYNPNPNPYDAFAGSWNFNGFGNGRDILGMEVGGTNPQLPDLVNGGLLADTTQLVTHEMLFGPPERWTKMAFYFKMNSAAGVGDGVFSQYINGHRIKHHDNVPWCGPNPEGLVTKWNQISIGGNDYFAPFAPSELFEDYYYIDELIVRDSLPEVLI